MWEIISEARTTEDGVDYTAYGIRKQDFSLADVSADREEAERLIELLNKYDASPIHAADIVEDFLAT